MAKYRMKEINKPLPAFIDEPVYIVGGMPNENYKISIGPLDIILSKEEKERTIDTWNKIDNGELKRGEES